MKNEYRSMMENLTLSPAARSAIEDQIAGTPAPVKRTGRPFRRVAIAAACLMLAVAAVGIPVMAEAMGKMEYILPWLTEKMDVKTNVDTYVPDSGSDFIAVTGEDEDGKKHGGVYYGGGIPSWLHQDDGRLYFTGNGEYIDITDQISFETPFTYVYTDDEQIIHYIAIGGVYDAELAVGGAYNTDPHKNWVGWAEYFQNAPGTEPMMPNLPDGWIGGYSRDAINTEDNTEYPWLTAAKEEFDTPWKDHKG